MIQELKVGWKRFLPISRPGFCVKHLKSHGKLYEIRAQGKDGVARVFYFTWQGQRIVLLHGFIKKSKNTPQKEIEIAVKRMTEVMRWLS